MFVIKLLAALIYAASTTSAAELNCANGRKCVYMEACNGKLTEECPLAYSYRLDGDILSMELAGYQPSGNGRYLAIGFNENSGMSNARVTECSAIGTEETPTVKLSWNKNLGTVNKRIDNEKDFRDEIISEPNSKYDSGLIYCSWKQNVGEGAKTLNNEKVFQLKKGVKYHHIVAYGATNDDSLRKHEGAQSTLFDTFDGSIGMNCGDGSLCVYKKECEGELKEECTLAYSYKLDGDYLIMEMAGFHPSGAGRYLAIGFNEKDGMENARVTECSSIGDVPTVKLSWNKDYKEGNIRIDNEKNFRDQIISEPNLKYDSGLIYCSWKQNVGEGARTLNNEKVFQMKSGVKYNHIIAYGETSAEGLKQHPKGGAQSTVFASFDGSVLDCTEGRTCVYIGSCNGVFDQNCPLAYSFKLEGDILSMELAGYQTSGTNRYLAVGFGLKEGMANSTVTECSAIGDEKLPTVKLSYNIYDEEGGLRNIRIDNEPSFRASIISDSLSKYEDGMIYCSWQQNVSASDNNMVFQHTQGEKYHHICAYGPTVSDATHSGLDYHDEYDKPLYVDFETPNDPGDISGVQLNCEGGRSCVYMNGCKGVFGTKCPLAYSYKLEGDILSMELAGYQKSGMNRYLAVGFGEKEGMGEAKVTECSAIGDEKYPTVKLSYNTPGDESVNVRIDSEPSFRASIISDEVSKYEDGMIYCSWKQNVSANSNDRVFQHTAGQKYHHICAYGPTAVDGDYAGLDEHDDYQKVMYATFETPTDPSDISKGPNCDGGRTCVFMKTCKEKFGPNCPLAFSFLLDGNILSMELAGYQKSGMNRYLAVGFGEKAGMEGSKVTECSAIGDEKFPSVKLSYNIPDDFDNVRIPDEPTIRDSIISDVFSKYQDGIMYCSWKQNISVSNEEKMDKVFQRTPGLSYYHIAAYGASKADGLTKHDTAEDTGKTDFEGSSETGGTSTSTKLKKAHGSLMMIAWLIFVPIAAIFARFLRAHWPTKKPFGLAIWFHVHRTSNILACLIIIAGFVCIFIEADWKWRGVWSGSGHYWLATHSTVGIIACVLAWLQPFISILRCDPQNPRRPIFNWVHRLIGVTAFVLAVTAVAIAANQFTSLWSDSLTYLILTFVPLGAVIILFVIMTILDAKVRAHDANIVKIHAIRFTLVCIAIGVAGGAAIALVLMLCLS